MKRLALVAAIVALAGCAQMLGLDDTKLDKIDAAIDAPGVCDGAPNCTSLNGRSVCGQLYQTGANAGMPLQKPNPTGMACQAGDLEGPCALKVQGQPRPAFLANTATGRVDGVVDDCGRYAVIDMDSTAADVAVIVSGDATMFKRTATLLNGRPTIGGPGKTDPNIDALVITRAQAMTWSTEVASGTPPDTSSGYVIRFLRQGRPLMKVQAARDGGNGLTAMNTGATPWAGYFIGSGIGGIDKSLIETQAAGAAFAVFGGGTFLLEGVVVGNRCDVSGLNQVDNTIIYVNVPSC